MGLHWTELAVDYVLDLSAGVEAIFREGKGKERKGIGDTHASDQSRRSRKEYSRGSTALTPLFDCLSKVFGFVLLYGVKFIVEEDIIEAVAGAKEKLLC